MPWQDLGTGNTFGGLEGLLSELGPPGENALRALFLLEEKQYLFSFFRSTVWHENIIKLEFCTDYIESNGPILSFLGPNQINILPLF